MPQQEKSAPQALAPNRVYRIPVPQTDRNDRRTEQVSDGGVIQMPLQEESASFSLAPSEVLLLNGEQATQTGLVRLDQGTRYLQLMTRASGVSRGELLLLVAAIRVALLAVERNGEIKLKVKKIVGILGSANSLIIEHGSAPGQWQWPPGSLEERIGPALARMSRTFFPRDTVAELIRYLGVNWNLWRTLVVNGYAELHLLTGIVDALVERGLADFIPGDGKLLGVFPYRRARAELSEAGQSAVADYDLEEVRQLLLRCKQKRPALWSRLDEEIVGGLVSALSFDWLGD